MNPILLLYMSGRVTPNNITSLDNNEVFVYGSNLAGIPGLGAALNATQWGAKRGQISGMEGSTYAIPTKDAAIRKALSLDHIFPFVDEFMRYAKLNEDKTFYVTKVGCGLAGYNVKDMAPLFIRCIKLSNVWLPKDFWEHFDKMLKM